jgi:hypothetical protein
LREAVAVWPVALDELLAAVVLTVSVAVTAAVPVMVGGAATEQVGRSTAVAGTVTVQESATAPKTTTGHDRDRRSPADAGCGDADGRIGKREARRGRGIGRGRGRRHHHCDDCSIGVGHDSSARTDCIHKFHVFPGSRAWLCLDTEGYGCWRIPRD